MFVEKQTTKILSSVGAIYKNGLNTHLFACRSYGAFAFLLALCYKHFTPSGLGAYISRILHKKPTLENLNKGG
jgi:hypothetical protein